MPVVRDADTKAFAVIEKEVGELRAQGARGIVRHRGPHRRHLHDHQRRGVRLAHVHAHRQRAAERDPGDAQDPGSADGGERAVVVRPMMYLAVTYDHRIIDGREAVQFLVAIKDALEDPGRILLGV